MDLRGKSIHRAEDLREALDAKNARIVELEAELARLRAPVQAAKALVAHHNEFGIEFGFGEALDALGSALKHADVQEWVHESINGVELANEARQVILHEAQRLLTNEDVLEVQFHSNGQRVDVMQYRNGLGEKWTTECETLAEAYEKLVEQSLIAETREMEAEAHEEERRARGI